MSHDRGATFTLAFDDVGVVWPTANTSMAYTMPHSSASNETLFFVTEDAGHSFQARNLPAVPLVHSRVHDRTELMTLVPWHFEPRKMGTRRDTRVQPAPHTGLLAALHSVDAEASPLGAICTTPRAVHGLTIPQVYATKDFGRVRVGRLDATH